MQSEKYNVDGYEFLVDSSILAVSLGVQVEQIERFLHIFVKSAKEDLIALNTALAIPDFKAIGMIGHRLKSSSSTVGAQQFSVLCKHLESFKNGDDANCAREIAEQLENQLKSIENHIENRDDTHR